MKEPVMPTTREQKANESIAAALHGALVLLRDAESFLPESSLDGGLPRALMYAAVKAIEAADNAVRSATQDPRHLTAQEIPANDCRHCTEPPRGHGQRWTDDAHWHNWTPPTPSQIKARMYLRRGLRIAARITSPRPDRKLP